ncbi:MAG TPA: site-specific DNA-methyltransferase [Acetobacteraceae bacterium]|nr:site-specific DNA-methyltransferase [Acetobacteraceae bacterium]
MEDYRHTGATRLNNPPAALAAEGRTPHAPKLTYAYSPRLDPALRFDPSGGADALPPLLEKAKREPLTAEEAALLAEALRQHNPWLEWAGKRETPRFAVDPVALHIHERVSTQAILRAAARQDVTRDLFADPQLSYAQAVRFYQHDMDWANRLILGDSLQVMASLAQRENLAGKVQMIYLDPPYGIRFRSNFQPETHKTNVTDRERDLTRELEMVRAYRDTWRLGVHSYLAYLRDRLIVARTLLSDSGSLFIQIGDENVHRVRLLVNEVFGSDSFVTQIVFKKTSSLGGDIIGQTHDFILWTCRNREKLKARQLFVPRSLGDDIGGRYARIELRSGLRATAHELGITPDVNDHEARVYRHDNLTSQSGTERSQFPIRYQGVEFLPGKGYWKSNQDGIGRLMRANRLGAPTDRSIGYVRYFSDFPMTPLTDIWLDTQTGAFTDEKVYVVQTGAKVIERCMLLTTDVGDLVLDPTSGSGTTAFVAERWGRRWITVDTSRVAVATARQRLMTAKFDDYQLKDEAKGLSAGFVYKTIPHVTLGSIAQNTALDFVFAKHDPVLEERLTELNKALLGVGANLRSHLAAKLTRKQQLEGRRSVTEADRRRWILPKASDQFQHWTTPFDIDPDYPIEFSAAVLGYRSAWRVKQDEVDAAIAAAAEPEELVDQPVEVPGFIRVSGPFTVEAVQPAEISIDDAAHASPIEGASETLEDTFASDTIAATAEPQNAEAYLDQMLRLLKLDGVRFLDNRVMKFSRLEQLGTRSSAIHAEGRWVPEGETDPDPEGRATVAVGFGPQYGPVTAEQVEQLLRAAFRYSYDELVVAGFSFDGAAQAIIDADPNPRVRVHMAHIRPDVNPGMTGLLKDTPAAQLFTVFGKPRSRVDPVGDEFQVVMEGVDIYDPVSNTIAPSRADKVAAWFIDSDYDGRTFCITQAFFPDKDAWSKLSAALKGVIDEEAFAKLSGTVSLPFPRGEHGCVAVKVIDPRGNEVMRLHRLDE